MAMATDERFMVFLVGAGSAPTASSVEEGLDCRRLKEVKVGEFANLEEAHQAARKTAADGFPNAEPEPGSPVAFEESWEPVEIGGYRAWRSEETSALVAESSTAGRFLAFVENGPYADGTNDLLLYGEYQTLEAAQWAAVKANIEFDDGASGG